VKSYHSLLPIIAMLCLTAIFSGCQPDSNSPEGLLKNADARQALSLANEWKWGKQEIQSYVTNREVVFKLPNDRVKRIPLPDSQMVVAVAPYVSQTHQ